MQIHVDIYRMNQKMLFDPNKRRYFKPDRRLYVPFSRYTYELGPRVVEFLSAWPEIVQKRHKLGHKIAPQGWHVVAGSVVPI